MISISLAEGRGLQRQLSISSRQPELRVRNQLGQDVVLSVGSRRPEAIASGQRSVATRGATEVEVVY